MTEQRHEDAWVDRIRGLLLAMWVLPADVGMLNLTFGRARSSRPASSDCRCDGRT